MLPGGQRTQRDDSEQHYGTPSTTVEGEGIMATSGFALTGRFLAGIAAASLLAGVSLDAAAYGSKGRILLQTGKTLPATFFTYETRKLTLTGVPAGPDDEILPGTSYSPQDSQLFTSGKGCEISTSPVFISVTPFGGRGSLGFDQTSIGVYDGPQGTACGRVSFNKDEALELKLVPAGLTGGGTGFSGPANAFDRLEIDVEVKGDVRLKVEVKFQDETPHVYWLLAGAGFVSPGDADGDDTVLDPDHDTYKCSAASDSGSDAGPRDNCRLRIADLGTSFKITPYAGEISLEGGGDFTDVRYNNTKIFLTEADGIFKCGDYISTAAGELSCGITRLDDSTCSEVPYIFRSDSNSCTLTTDMGGTQLIANLFVTYSPELARTTDDLGNPVNEGNLDNLDVWLPATLSQVVFAGDLPGDSHDIPPCLDKDFVITETILDDDGSGPHIDTGPVPFAETAVRQYDRLGADLIQFACAFLRQEIYENPDGLDLKVRIKEGIQFWGDITFVRGQE
jgi:hypothetical protein